MTRPFEVQICEDLLELQGYSASKVEIAQYKGKPEIQVHILRIGNPRCSSYIIALLIYKTNIKYTQSPFKLGLYKCATYTKSTKHISYY